MLLYLIIPFFFIKCVYPGALQLNQQTFESALANHELVFVNYYANWCRFSQMLEPIFDEFADKLVKEIPPNKVAIGKVDCDVESQVATQNQINKYPTLKLYRYGVATKKEYRGGRSAEAFIVFIKEQLANPAKIVKNQVEFSTAIAESKKRSIVGYFSREDSKGYEIFLKLSSILRDSCTFIVNLGAHPSEKITFRESLDQGEILFDGDLHNYEALYGWSNEKCTPLVREITFENAEELTEEGLPFLILFHKPDDRESIKLYEKEVQRQLIHLRNTINPVYADGHKFSHPLNHLGKSTADLPLLAVDSFRHMYLFPSFSKMSEGDNLLKFIQDLHSGKLHREFHNGPDPTTPPQLEGGHNNLPSGGDKNAKSTPPESVFIKLAPSRDRYTLKLDGEL